MDQVRREHRVEADLTETPAAPRQGVACALRVVNDQGRGLGEDLGQGLLLRGAELGGVYDQGVSAPGEHKA